MWPSVGLDHSKPRMAVKEWSALAPSASWPVAAHCASSMPSAPSHPPSLHSASTDSALLTVAWSVSAATSSPAARMEANAAAGSPSPSL